MFPILHRHGTSFSKVENKINGKIYIGQTIRTLEKRKSDHINDTFEGSSLPFHNAIKKYGQYNFGWKILEECNSIEELNEKEEYWIRKLNTISPNGYNLRYGGKSELDIDLWAYYDEMNDLRKFLLLIFYLVREY